MNDDAIQDEVLFDRLVDGELTDAERRRLLASLDVRPDGWRRCALAFLEAQSWTSDIRQFVRETVPAPGADELSQPASAYRKRLRRGAAWLAIATCVLVAFAVGRIRSDSGHLIATVAPSAEEQFAADAPPAEETAPSPEPVDDALTLWVRDDSGQSRAVRVPLVDAGELDRELGVTFQSALPSGIRERLQQRGYDLQSKRRYAPLWLENGRPMIVPVEDTRIVPVSQNVY